MGDEARTSEHRFFSIMAIASAAVVLLGFGSKYPHTLASSEPVPWILHVHAAVFTSWLLLFVAQTTLVRKERIDLHRRLGVAGAVLAVMMLVLGVQTALVFTRLGHAGIPGLPLPDPGTFLLINLFAVGIFAILCAAGLYFRRRAPLHKRLMLLSTISLMPPGIARLPVIGGHIPAVAGLTLAFVLAGPIYDLVTKRGLHRAYVLGGLLILVPAPPVLVKLAATPAWHKIADWLT
jgi:uncharacterized membrane protein YozB (DUF420 family)